MTRSRPGPTARSTTTTTSDNEDRATANSSNDLRVASRSGVIGRREFHAHRIRHLDGAWPEISLGSRFSWNTLGAPETTIVTECEPYERLAWTGTGRSARGHHA